MKVQTVRLSDRRRIGWFWPLGLAVLAFASASLIWSALLAGYNYTAPSHICYQLGVRYQVVSWTTVIWPCLDCSSSLSWRPSRYESTGLPQWCSRLS